jgi:hypothetical protein
MTPFDWVPEQLSANWRNHGERQAWLDSLPAMLEELTGRWSLRIPSLPSSDLRTGLHPPGKVSLERNLMTKHLALLIWRQDASRSVF